MFTQLWSTESSVAYKFNTPELGDVVLKKCDIMNGSQAAELMKHEIQIYHHLQSLQGVYIPKLHVAGVADGLEFVLVTEYVGKTIEELKLTFEDGVTIIKSLAALHDAGVLHGDIRPENITRLCRDGKYGFRFINFGYSKVAAKSWEYRREMVDLARMLEAQLDPEVDDEDHAK
ncbi:transcription termination factor, RNA polymerase II [Podila minutissima]|nr:transcription termination factor, RNA polymerase II [Podila minutissima]